MRYNSLFAIYDCAVYTAWNLSLSLITGYHVT